MLEGTLKAFSSGVRVVSGAATLTADYTYVSEYGRFYAGAYTGWRLGGQGIGIAQTLFRGFFTGPVAFVTRGVQGLLVRAGCASCTRLESVQDHLALPADGVDCGVGLLRGRVRALNDHLRTRWLARLNSPSAEQLSFSPIKHCGVRILSGVLLGWSMRRGLDALASLAVIGRGPNRELGRKWGQHLSEQGKNFLANFALSCGSGGLWYCIASGMLSHAHAVEYAEGLDEGWLLLEGCAAAVAMAVVSRS